MGDAMSKPAGCKRWSVAEGHVAKRADGAEPDGANDVLWLLNASTHEAHVEIMVYFEHRAPAGPYRFTLLPKRSRRVRWQDLEGNVHEELMEGMMATCIQHEMDHLEGILFIDHLSRLKRNMALKKLEKLRKAA